MSRQNLTTPEADEPKSAQPTSVNFFQPPRHREKPPVLRIATPDEMLWVGIGNSIPSREEADRQLAWLRSFQKNNDSKPSSSAPSTSTEASTTSIGMQKTM